jgi:hypothetical protein
VFKKLVAAVYLESRILIVKVRAAGCAIVIKNGNSEQSTNVRAFCFWLRSVCGAGQAKQENNDNCDSSHDFTSSSKNVPRNGRNTDSTFGQIYQ